MGVRLDRFDRVVALAGNPNTGKSTFFNALTGLSSTRATGRARRSAAPRAASSSTRSATSWWTCRARTRSCSASQRRRSRARLPAVRPARRDGRRRRRDVARAESESRAAGARDHGPRGGRRQPDGRGAAARASRSTSAASRAISACRRSRIVARTGEGLHALLETVDARGVRRRSRRSRCASPALAGVPARGRRAGARSSKRRRPACPTRAGSRFACSTATRRSRRRCRPAELGELVAGSRRAPATLQPEDRAAGRPVMRAASSAASSAAPPRCAELRSSFRDEAVRVASTPRRRASRIARCAGGVGARGSIWTSDRSARDSPVFGLPLMSAAARPSSSGSPSRAPTCRRRCWRGVFFWVEDQAAARVRSAGHAVVAHRFHLARRLLADWRGSSA